MRKKAISIILAVILALQGSSGIWAGEAFHSEGSEIRKQERAAAALLMEDEEESDAAASEEQELPAAGIGQAGGAESGTQPELEIDPAGDPETENAAEAEGGPEVEDAPETESGAEAEDDSETESAAEAEDGPQTESIVDAGGDPETEEIEEILEDVLPEEETDDLIEDPDQEEELFAVSETLELSDPAVVPENASYGIKAFDLVSYSGCFGNQLSGTALELYEARVDYYVVNQGTGTMKLNYDRSASPVTFTADVITNENGSKQIDQTTENYKEFRQEVVFAMQSSLDAMIYDHPEIFWLRSGTYTFSVGAYGSSAKGWVGYLSGITYTPKTAFDGAEALAASFRAGVAQAVSRIQAEADEKGNRDGNTDVLELARAAHDYLCERLYYDTAALQTYQETGDYRIFCAAGAFVDSVGSGVVCEGYAKAYKILCDQMGIPCVLIGGTVVQGGRSEGHMWNGVCLAGGWYLTDVTWDDKSGGYTHDYFMVGNSTSGRSSSGNFSGSEPGNTTLFAYPILSSDPLNPCDADSHSWDNGTQTAATCVEPAHTLYTCTRCGCTYRSGYTGTADLSNHDYKETERKAAACTASGYILYTCTRVCTEDHTRKEILPVLGHHYVNGVCTRCGQGDTLAHAAVSAVPARTYTGSRITPSPVVKFGTNTLKLNTDYRLVYQNNLRAGTAAIVIRGIGKYSGTKTVTFQIKKKSISGLSYGKAADRTYTGRSHWPGIAVKDGSRSLVRGTDYSLSHSNNKEVGTATITVKGIGSYTGTKKITFRINPKAVTGQKVSSKTRGRITVSWKKVSGSSGYQIQYALSGSFSGAKTVTAKAGSSSKGISGLKPGKRYYVRIRSFRTVKGKKYYSSWCAKKNVTVKK